MEPSKLIIKSLDTRRRSYQRELNRARSEFSPDAVHDLRVAIRRLLALLELIRTLDPNASLQPLRRELKAQLDSLDPLRDTQVMLEQVEKDLEDLPALLHFRERLAGREQELLETTRESIGGLKFTELSRLIGGLLSLRGYLAGALDLGDPLSAMDKAFRKVSERAASVDVSQPGSFHHVRVAFKKFRYGVEIVHPLVPDFPRANLKAMDGYQTALGHIQDAVVLMAALEEFADDDDGFDMAPNRPHFDQRLADTIDTFVAQRDDKQHFWRSEAGQPFPWEMNQ